MSDEYEFTCLDPAAALGDWPNCAIPDCPNKTCLHLGSDKCWPHTVGQPFNCHDGMSEEEITEFNARIEDEWLARTGMAEEKEPGNHLLSPQRVLERVSSGIEAITSREATVA